MLWVKRRIGPRITILVSTDRLAQVGPRVPRAPLRKPSKGFTVCAGTDNAGGLQMVPVDKTDRRHEGLPMALSWRKAGGTCNRGLPVLNAGKIVGGGPKPVLRQGLRRTQEDTIR